MHLFFLETVSDYQRFDNTLSFILYVVQHVSAHTHTHTYRHALTNTLFHFVDKWKKIHQRLIILQLLHSAVIDVPKSLN